eukprot:2999530-Rhodomonas_salina.2
MVAMEAGALSTVEDLVSTSTESRVDPSKPGERVEHPDLERCRTRLFQLQASTLAPCLDSRLFLLQSPGSVLIPINLNNEHWIAASLNIEQLTISICDSLGGKHPVVARNLTAWFTASFGTGDSLPIVDYAPVQKQVEVDCVVAAIMYITLDALNLEGLPPMDKAVAIRSFITGLLLMGSLRI